VTPAVVTGNVYDKYRTSNPLYRTMMRRFLASCRELLATVGGTRLLEVGCGPGDLARHLIATLPALAGRPYWGLDLGLGELAQARSYNPEKGFVQASAYRLPFPDGAFDCVLACEVFEHLDDPAAALAEVRRVASSHLLLSVPWEPLWRLLNLARGSYWRDLGNTPGHVQHYSRRAIRRLVAQRFEVVAERRPFPWTVLLARVAAPA